MDDVFSGNKKKVIRCSFCKLSKVGTDFYSFDGWSFGVSTPDGLVLCPDCFKKQTGMSIGETCQ